ncbi:PQQ-binding-like beta-propeller repeat protein [Verrucomicrobiota bacterium]
MRIKRPSSFLISRLHAGVLILWAASLAGSSEPASAAAWPSFGGDSARSGVTTEKLDFPLAAVWRFQPGQPPSPAWPEPGKEWHRMDFDFAFQPVVAGGRVYFGSSSDDTVRALDLSTGEAAWIFVTGGPVRFAPALAGGKLYVASDDGWLYALDPEDGGLLWRRRGGPGDDRILGNGRMISRWPIRSGVAVRDGVVYFAAGMWPDDGVYVRAVSADKGEDVWCNASATPMYVNQPHPGASAFTGVCPQGYILATEDLLLVPSGRTTPAAYDRGTGRLVYYQPYLMPSQAASGGQGHAGNGGSWILVAGEVFLNPKHLRGAPDIGFRSGEASPRAGEGLAAYSLDTGLHRADLAGKYYALSAGGTLYAVGNGELVAIDLETWLEGGAWTNCVEWTSEHPRAYSMALAGNALLVGGADSLTAFDPETGAPIWQCEVDGQVRGIAVADGRVLASTSEGTIVCYERQAIEVPTIPVRDRLVWDLSGHARFIPLAADIANRSGKSEGYAVVIGEPDAHLAAALCTATDLSVISVLGSADAVKAERDRLLTTDLYGSRIVVDHVESLAKLPYASYFADLAVVSDREAGAAPEDLYRILRPCGGVLCFPGMERSRAQRFAEQAGIPPDELEVSEGMVLVRRGPLPGAGEWRHQWADSGKTGIGEEARVRPPFDVLWFGGPSPGRLMARHWGTSTPLSVDGRVFMTGDRHVIAFDAYNGRELWARELAGTGRKAVTYSAANTAADDDSLYVAVGPACHRLDQKTGRTLAVYSPPALPGAGRGAGVAEEIPVDVEWPTVWQVFGQFPKEMDPLPGDALKAVPEVISFDGTDYTATPLRAVNGALDLTCLYGGYGIAPLAAGEEPGPYPRPNMIKDMAYERRIAYAFAEIDCRTDGVLTVGTGADWWMKWYIDGEPVFDTLDSGNRVWPYAVNNHVFSTEVSAGKHVVAVLVKSGAAGWVLFSVGGARYESALKARPDPAGSDAWGYLSVSDDLVLGTLMEPGTHIHSRQGATLFAIDKNDGSLRWRYDSADKPIPARSVAWDGERVFALCVTSGAKTEAAARRGEERRQGKVLVALDLNSGAELWRREEVPSGDNHVQCAQGVVVVGAQAAYEAGSGAKLWEQLRFLPERPPLIHEEWVIAQPRAYSLRTGKLRMTSDILTGEPREWRFTRAYGCGPIAGCRNMLFFRSGTFGFFDFTRDGTATFGGIRPACSISMVAANGLMLLPEGDAGCSCAYNFQTSVALVSSASDAGYWTVFEGERGRRPLHRVGINLGAPGDRRDADGVAWLTFPRPTMPRACPLSVRVQPGGSEDYYLPAADVAGSDAERAWVYSSGIRGAERIDLGLVLLRPALCRPCEDAPAIDGSPDDACWSETDLVEFEVMPEWDVPDTEMRVCRDAENLYIAYRRHAILRDGEVLPLPPLPDPEGEGKEGPQDSLYVYFTDGTFVKKAAYAVTSGGVAAEGLSAVEGWADMAWTTVWTNAVSRGEGEWTAEMAIPLAGLRKAGIDPDSLAVNARATMVFDGGERRDVWLSQPSGWNPWGPGDFRDLTADLSPEQYERSYTVRMHFSEPEEAKAGERVFEIKIQGELVAAGFDIAAESGGPGKAVVKEFTGIPATWDMTIEFVPRSGSSEPVINGLEILAEQPPA